jgi:hypothetical protein
VLQPPANQTNQTCTDTDGYNYYNKGNVTAYDAQAGRYVTAIDSCEYNTINEFICNGTEGKETEYECPYGCDDGACKNQPVNQTLSSCFDGIRNQDESDVDCGGTCMRCSNGLKCSVPSNCLSGICLNMVCVSSSGNQTPTNETSGNSTIPGNQT